jgi:mitotic spindle assembly checkpoint protein MAD2|tara:strand:+ start:21705 stop:22343 length:639 start_codon:yes stop_codon:yes gene_type:complete|mmetsp:Transcript_4025/g.14786  ORF Transcript_4025/g.14786 Transcript_4025/m.14786 type:complete len:213 (+) Transcript_4025:120-758(+)
MATAQTTKNAITLKGSTAIVTEFFGYAVNSILYQRGIYPPETFERKQKYGLGMLVTTDDGLKTYLVSVLQQINDWMMSGGLQKLVLVVTAVGSKEPLERWVFDVVQEAEVGKDGTVLNDTTTKEKSEKEITAEISAIIRQVTASVTFLPLLEEPCTFDLLAYTDADSEVPQTWEESDARNIVESGMEQVKLRSFSTNVHKVEGMVSYRAGED